MFLLRSTAGNFGPGRVETAVNEDTTATPDENQQQEQNSESSDDEIPLSQLLGKGLIWL